MEKCEENKKENKNPPPNLGGVRGGKKQTKKRNPLPIFPYFSLFFLIAVGVSLSASFFLRPSYSAGELPYPEPKSCEQNWRHEMAAMEQDWKNYLDMLMAQEKPASELVDDAFSSLRTYQCWTAYLCDVVAWNGTAKPDQTGILTDEEIPTRPGCAPIDVVQIPSATLGYMPLCASDKQEKTVTEAGTAEYDKCMEQHEKNQSVTMMILEQRLRTAASDKQTAVLGKKLQEINEEMRSLEYNVNNMGDQMGKLDDRIPCFPKKCD